MAGCPKCAIDLIRANPHKPVVRHQNGFVTFASLVPGEVLKIPEKWHNGELDTRPRAYFAALPYTDGVTPSSLGLAAAGVLNDYADLDTATILIGTLATIDDPSFVQMVPEATALIDGSVATADSSSNPVAVARAKDVHAATAAARASAAVMAAALAAGDQSAAMGARLAAQNSLSAAIGSVRLALQAAYSGEPAATMPSTLPQIPPAVLAAAQAAAAAIKTDPNYCANIGNAGSAVNAAVHAFKTAWNATQTPKIPVNTGNYEQETAEILADVLGGAPLPCDPVEITPTPTAPKPPPYSPPPFVASNAPSGEKISTGSVTLIALLAASAAGGAYYLVKQRT